MQSTCVHQEMVPTYSGRHCTERVICTLFVASRPGETEIGIYPDNPPPQVGQTRADLYLPILFAEESRNNRGPVTGDIHVLPYLLALDKRLQIINICPYERHGQPWRDKQDSFGLRMGTGEDASRGVELESWLVAKTFLPAKTVLVVRMVPWQSRIPLIYRLQTGTSHRGGVKRCSKDGFLCLSVFYRCGLASTPPVEETTRLSGVPSILIYPFTHFRLFS